MEREHSGSGFDPYSIRNRLMACFKVYETPDSIKVRELLEAPFESFDEQACLDQVREIVLITRDEKAAGVKNDFSIRIRQTYPASPNDTLQPESPKRFLKRHDLDSSFRPQLRQAQADVIENSQDCLLSAIDKDEAHKSYSDGIDSEEIREDILTYRQGLVDEIISTAEAIKMLLPTRRHVLPTGFYGQGDIPRMHTVMGVGVPEDASEKGELDSALLKLRLALQALRQDAETVAISIGERYKPMVAADMPESLTQHYETIEMDFLQALPEELDNAYRSAANLGPLYRPTPKPAEPVEIQPDLLKDERPVPIGEITPETIELGEITNPFPWSQGEQTTLCLLKRNGDSLLFCEAMPPIAASISKELRTQKNYGDELDELWARVRDVESSGTHAAQGYSKRAWGISNEMFKSSSILYYGNVGSNARRIYYVRVGTDKYDSVQRLATAAGYESPLPLLALIGETDKANQIKLLGSMGVSRAVARTAGAGSI